MSKKSRKAAKISENRTEPLQQSLAPEQPEQQVLAYEIHDGLVQYATGALMQIEAARAALGQNPAAQQSLSQAERWLREAIDEARRIIAGLRPPMLEESGIVASLEHLVGPTLWPAGIAVEFQHHLARSRLPRELELTLFRIAQEALANVRKHSGSDRVRISLAQDQARVRLEIEDFGRGFDPEAVKSESFGLRGMRDRVALRGGSLTIDSAPGKGCRVTAEFPLAG